MTWGSLQPRLLMPTEAEGWSRERIRHVFLHELAHVRRWDHATSTLCALACAIHWFNPAVWWAAGRARLERENACDDRVLAAGCRPSEYARDLLAMARSLRLPRTLSASSIPMARASQLSPRLRSILDPGRGREGAGPVTVAFGLVMVGVLVVPLGVLAPRPRLLGPPTETEPPGSRAAPVPAALPAEVEGELPAVASSLNAKVLPTGELRAPGGYVGLVPVVGLAAPGSVTPLPFLVVANRRSTPQDVICSQSQGGRRSTSVSDDDEGTIEALWSTDDCRVSVEIRGDIRFTANEDGVEAMGPRSFLGIDQRIDGLRRELEVEPGDQGWREYVYRVNGDTTPFDAEAQAWLATLLPQLFRETGHDAEARVRRILSQGGVPAVLDEVGLINSDYVTGLYLGFLIEHGDLSTAEFDEVMALAGSRIDSDYELAELLIRVASTEGLSPSIRDTYLGAAQSLDSDYEHRRVLSVLLDQPDLEPTLIDAVIGSATRIDSDYERAELLIQAQGLRPLSGPGQDAYLEAVDGLASDYEARRVLDGFLDHGQLSTEELAKVLELAGNLDSDYERAELLIRVGSENQLRGAATDAYLDAVRTMDSDYELRRTLSSVLERGEVDDDGLATVLSLAHSIGSDYERAELLVQVARGFRLTEDLRDDYRDAAYGIGSEHEQDRAFAALARNEGAMSRP